MSSPVPESFISKLLKLQTMLVSVTPPVTSAALSETQLGLSYAHSSGKVAQHKSAPARHCKGAPKFNDTMGFRRKYR
jgi:hypothetical protein